MASIIDANVVNTSLLSLDGDGVTSGLIRFGVEDESPSLGAGPDGFKIYSKGHPENPILEVTDNDEFKFKSKTIISKPEYGDSGIYAGVLNDLVEIDLGTL